MTTKRLVVLSIALLMAGAGCFGASHFLDGGGSIPFIEREKHPGAKLVIVEESGDRDNEAAIFVRNTTYHASLEARGLKWGVYDDESPNGKIYRDVAEQKGVGLPALIFVSADRDVLDVRKWPVADLDEAVKEVTGL